MTDRDFLARPGQPLSEHLEGVEKNARRLVPSDRKTPAGNSLQEMVGTAARLHDAGKYTGWFQEYLGTDRGPKPRERHADVGAFLTFHALAERGFPKDEAVAGLHAVGKHHGALPNLGAEHHQWRVGGNKYELLGEKLRNISDGASDAVEHQLQQATDKRLSWDDVPVEDPGLYRSSLPEYVEDDSFYPLVLQVWSTLTCADKLDAAGVTVEPDVSLPDPRRISFDESASGVTAELNARRTRAREQARRGLLDGVSEGHDVFTLTLPTGFGKTSAGLDAALHLAERKEGRVVYALPYTTVIDQVHEAVLEHLDVEPETDWYTIHHHLVDTLTRVGGDGERISRAVERLYGESWQAGLVLTTFVQLIESLAGPQNVQSIKLPALHDSVVVVDEPQALPRRWWHLVSRLTSVLVEDYDATVVLMTATQPRFIDEYDFETTTRELIPDTESYFGFLADHERVRFVVDESVRSTVTGTGSGAAIAVEDAAERMVDSAIEENRDVLAVCNTVESTATLGAAVVDSADSRGGQSAVLGDHVLDFVAENATELVAALRGEGSVEALADQFLSEVADEVEPRGPVVATLTAVLRPCDRALLIEAMRRVVADDVETPLDDRPLVVSATQLVEAGVDVSFDEVYRDFAPIPSVVQAAGRCNRSFGRGRGTVTIWRLDGDPPPLEALYGRGGSRLAATREALGCALDGDGVTVGEAEMVETVVEVYYDTLHSVDHTRDDADSLVTAFDDARGEELREASLIDDDAEEFLVVTSGHDMALLRRYVERREGVADGDAKAAFGALKHLLASLRTDDSAEYEDTPAVLSELGFEGVELDELTVVDDRDGGRYTVADGRGLRKER